MPNTISHDALALAARVALRAVEEVYSGVVGGFHAGEGLRVVDVAAAGLAVGEPAAEREGGDLEAAAAQEAVGHFGEVFWGFHFGEGMLELGGG